MSQPPGIFVFTTAREAAIRNMEVSFWNPVIDRIGQELAQRSQLDTSEHVYAWGAAASPINTTRWRHIRCGDWMLCAAQKLYRGAARVKATLRNPDIARELWGVGEDGRTWELMLLLDKPSRIHVPIDGLQQFLHSRYQGFTRVSDLRLERIQERFGSVDAFVCLHLLAPEHGTQTITRSDVLDAIAAYDSRTVRDFGPSVVWELIHEGRAYPPKAIYALASERTTGRVLSPSEVDSGVNSLCFHTLRSLGFEIRKLAGNG